MQGNMVQVDDARLSVPDGGIASFVSADYDDDEEDFGSEGIAQFPALAQRMAAMGRGGDTVLGHLTPGELVIPRDLIERDPALKEGLFQRLRDMGVENPEQYVVGSDANSINPQTGQPEFFRKFFRKVGKAIKKVVKSIVKVVKKIAPIVLPIALAFTPLGAVLGPALGSGIATLINGGSLKDAVKSAAITGLTAGVFQGVTGAGTFAENVRGAVTDPIGRISQTLSGAGSTLTGGGFTGTGNLFTPYAAPGAAGAALPPSGAETAPVNAAEQVTADAVSPARLSSTSTALPDQISQVAADAVGPGTFGENIKDAFMPGGKSFTQSMRDAFFPGAGAVDTMAIGNQAYTAAYKNAMTLPGMTQSTAAQIAQKAMQNAVSSAATAAAPGFLRTYGPLALAGTALAAGSGMFTPVPGEEPGLVQYDEEGNVITGQDLIDQDPGKYLVGDLGGIQLDPETGEYGSVQSIGQIGDLTSTYRMPESYSVPTSFPTNPPPFLMGSTPGGPFARPSVLRAAEGGAIFPRRNGGIMPDEGVPGQDSVRAMLMPGEFVMTTNAVRGLGNGDLNNGIKNMYSVMRNLESRGRATA